MTVWAAAAQGVSTAAMKPTMSIRSLVDFAQSLVEAVAVEEQTLMVAQMTAKLAGVPYSVQAEVLVPQVTTPPKVEPVACGVHMPQEAVPQVARLAGLGNQPLGQAVLMGAVTVAEVWVHPMAVSQERAERLVGEAAAAVISMAQEGQAAQEPSESFHGR